MPHYYCSAFSGPYCYQGLILYNSLKKQNREFTLFYVCLDQEAYDIFNGLNMENLVVIKVEQLEDYFSELKTAKKDRALYEYAWTIKASELLYILENYPMVDKILWLDGDTEMLSDPEAIFDEWGDNSIILTEQYYTGHHEHLIKTYGRFQAGFVGFKKDEEGLQCLRWWKDKCVEWCYGVYNEGRWADQKYLDEVPDRYEKVCIVKSLGINMTPFILYRFNHEQQKILEPGPDGLYVDGIKLVLYHYYGFRYIDCNNIDLCNYWMKFTRSTIEYLYIPYIDACKKAIKEIEAVKPDYKHILGNYTKRICNYFVPTRCSSSAAFDAATIISSETLLEGLVLYNSLMQHESSFYWWICCIDLNSYNIMKLLQLPNTSVIYINNMADDALKEAVSNKSDTNDFEKLKLHFIYYLLKNNYSINKLLLLDSSFYLFKSISDVFEKAKDSQAVLFTHRRLNDNRTIEFYDKDIIGLVNSQEMADFLEYCIYSAKESFFLIDKIVKYLKTHIIDGYEYCCTLNDLKYNRANLINGNLYINKSLIRAFHFSDNKRLQNGIIRTNRKAKACLKKDLYNHIYGQYNKALNRIKQIILGY